MAQKQDKAPTTLPPLTPTFQPPGDLSPYTLPSDLPRGRPKLANILNPASNTETEDAAQALEDFALGGRRPYGPLGINSEVPARAMGVGAVQPVAGAFTSIFIPSAFILRPRELVSLLRALPEQAVSEALVGIFFAE